MTKTKNKHKQQIENLDNSEIPKLKAKGAVISEDRNTGPDKMKIDLHCHTEASWDCSSPIEKFPKRLIEQGIKVQAITDHNEIWGAVKLKELVEREGHNLTIIVGEEILTNEGEIIGLFLKQKVEKGLSPEETIEKVREQGGITILPHGFDPYKRSRLEVDARERVDEHLDIIETFNTRVSNNKWNSAAYDFARNNNRLMSAGSDAHTLRDVGTAWVEVPEQKILSPDHLLTALENGLPTGTWINPLQAVTYRAWDMAKNFILNFRR